MAPAAAAPSLPSATVNYGGGDFSTTKAVPITEQRPVAVDLDKHIKNPGAGRATRAVTKEKPEGSAQPNDSRTVLQQHVDFWDFDKDGLIYPQDTYLGFVKLGFGWFLSLLSIPIIHGTFAYFSQDCWIPSPTFAIHTKNMHQTRHGSDSQVYDSEGRFVPQKFEDLFTKLQYDKDNKGGLTFKELLAMGVGNRKIMDPVGWSAAAFEWGITFWLLPKKDGYITKEDIRATYDGSIFYKIDAQNQSKKAVRHTSKKLA